MPGKRWTKNELKALTSQWAERRDACAISIRGRSVHSIKRKLIREELLCPTEPPREAWSAGEEALLRELAAQGFTARQMAQAGKLARSTDSIAQKMRRMKLLHGKKRSRVLRECRRLSGEELDEFVNAVREYGDTRHTQWFVWKYAVGRGRIKRALAEIGKVVTWKDAMQLPQTKSRFAARVSVASRKAWERHRENLRDRMVARLKEMQSEIDAKPALSARENYKRRVCGGCEGSWFASEDFFKPLFKRFPDGSKKKYLKRKCRICTFGERGSHPSSGNGNGNGNGNGSAHAGELDNLQRAEWRRQLSVFADELSGTLPALFRDPETFRVLRWEPFVELLVTKTAAELMELAQSVVAAYNNANVTKILNEIEETCFDGGPELHVDVWELDEITRSPTGLNGAPFVRRERLLHQGQQLAIRLYRVLRLPDYAKSLV
jgi:hypothetical protein